MQTQTATQPGNPAAIGLSADAEAMVLTLTVAGQLCGVPVLGVRDVLGPQAITRIPLAPPEVAGSLNLRGRIVTAIDLRRRLSLPARGVETKPMSVVVEHQGELYSLLADQVGDVLTLNASERAANPPTLEPSWKEVSLGVHRLGEQLLVVLDVERLMQFA